MRFGQRLMLMSASGVCLCVGLYGLAASVAETRQTKIAEQQLQTSIQDQGRLTLAGISNMVRSQDEAIGHQVDSELNVASALMKQTGTLHLGESVPWKAVNQFDKSSVDVKLPRFSLGSTWLGQTKSAKQTVPIVDKAKELTGGTMTIFQRMNAQGDMLRIATNILGKTGDRAIGTYIPATNPDGKPNPVLAQILNGKPFHGTAFVVDNWYVAAYQPILKDGKVVGMVYAGERQESVPSLRQAITSQIVGKTGHAFIVSTKGAEAGTVLIGNDQFKDASNVLDAKDTAGAAYIKAAIEKAKDLKTGEVASIPYKSSTGDTDQLFVAYYAPWDWVVVADSHQADFKPMFERLSDAHRSAMTIMVSAGIAMLGITIVAVFLWTKRELKPLEQVTAAAKAMALGEFVAIDHKSNDEFGELASAFRDLRQTFESYTSNLESIGNGDLTVKITSKSANDHFGIALQTMVQSLRKLLSQVTQGATIVAETSENLMEKTHQAEQSGVEANSAVHETANAISDVAAQNDAILQGSHLQRDAAIEAGISLEQATKATGQVAASNTQILQRVKETAETAQAGVKAVNDTVAAMDRVESQVQASTAIVGRLDERSRQIAEITSSIESIAGQTNMLALNAAIEAARAGEHGRGFAVVADEVRHLAEQSSQASSQIRDIANAILTEISETIKAMQTSTQEVQATKALSTETHRRLHQIAESAVNLESEVQSVGAVSQELTRAVESVRQTFEKVVEITESNEAAVEHSANTSARVAATTEEVTAFITEQAEGISDLKRSAVSLQELASSLQKTVAGFQLEESGASHLRVAA